MDSAVEIGDYEWGKRHAAIQKAEISALYHQKRERFFELCDKLSKAAAVIGGSAALWKLGNDRTVAVIATGIASTSALSLVFSFSERSKKHAEFARGYRTIVAEIVAKGERDFNETDVNAWLGKLASLEATEPPSLSTLVVLCQNEIAIARDQPSKVRPIPWFKRQFANVLDMPLSS